MIAGKINFISNRAIIFLLSLNIITAFALLSLPGETAAGNAVNISGLKFSTMHDGPFSFNYRCSRERMEHIKSKVMVFYREIYPRFFKAKNIATIRFVFYKNKNEYTKNGGISRFGHYRYADRSIYTHVNAGGGTFFHEMIHAFVHANEIKNIQQWFSEGFASFYEMSAVNRGKVIEGYTNWRLPELKKTIRAGRLIPLKKFLLMDKIEYNPGWSEARFLFCYLWIYNKMDQFIKTYLYELAPMHKGSALGKEAVKLLEKLIGRDIDSINDEYIKLALKYERDQKLHQRARP